MTKKLLKQLKLHRIDNTGLKAGVNEKVCRQVAPAILFGDC